MKDTVVFDLDGTLANIDHRLHFIKREKPDWDGFFKACVDDSVNEWCAEMISAFNSAGKTVLIVSARSKMVEKETEDWILKHVGPFARLILLREEGNTTPDDELKINWLHKFGKENILFIVDDRQRVVDMWRKEGLVCLQCYAWPEWKPKKPASDTPEKPKDFIEKFRLYFAHLARKYPERTLFTEGRDPIQDELVGLHHLAEASDTPARTEWVEKVIQALEILKPYHFECDGDSWYSCPKSDGGCANDQLDDVCNCGADKKIAIWEEALALMKGKEKSQ